MQAIDAVILWVDGADHHHKSKRLFYKNNTSTHTLRNEAFDEKRFSSSNEIYYSLHLLRKNAQWIRKIFLITDNQKPKWLDDKKKRELDIEVIDHSLIFRGYEKCLPTFNSTSIECMIHKVPGISDNFVYLNDDFFILRPVGKYDFFQNEKLMLRGSIYFKGFERISSFLSYPSWFDYSGLNSYRGHRSQRALYLFPFVRAHAPYSCNKRVLEKVFNSYERYQNALYKFRDKQQFNPIDIMYNWLLREKKAKIIPRDWAYFSPNIGSTRALKKILIKCQEKKNIKMLCIQDLSELNETERSNVYGFLSKFI